MKFPLRPSLARLAWGLVLFTASLGWAAPGVDRTDTGPWDLAELSRPPAITWGASQEWVQEAYYPGERLNGKPTRVFAYVGRPAPRSPERAPGMVLVHGGGGKAFKEWAEHWAKRGYVAIAMDLAGSGPQGRLEDGGPDQSDAVKFRNFEPSQTAEMWSYHAVAAVVRGHSLLRSLPEADPDRIGITGISWGGYLTCIVAGLDSRLKVAVPVYGCGFLGENSHWTTRSLASMTPDARERWLRLFDPSQRLGGTQCPILFLNGTTDFAYPLDSYQKSYRLVCERLRHVSVVVNLPHGHIWTFPEVDAFVDSVLRSGPAFPRLSGARATESSLAATADSPGGIREASLCYTTDAGPWQQRTWKTVRAQAEGQTVSASLPEDRPLVAFLSITDPAGLRASTEHVEFPGQ